MQNHFCKTSHTQNRIYLIAIVSLQKCVFSLKVIMISVSERAVKLPDNYLSLHGAQIITETCIISYLFLLTLSYVYVAIIFSLCTGYTRWYINWKNLFELLLFFLKFKANRIFGFINIKQANEACEKCDGYLRGNSNRWIEFKFRATHFQTNEILHLGKVGIHLFSNFHLNINH